jgi:hypothetical protein
VTPGNLAIQHPKQLQLEFLVEFLVGHVLVAMSGKNRQLVKDEPIEFEK